MPSKGKGKGLPQTKGKGKGRGHMAPVDEEALPAAALHDQEHALLGPLQQAQEHALYSPSWTTPWATRHEADGVWNTGWTGPLSWYDQNWETGDYDDTGTYADWSPLTDASSYRTVSTVAERLAAVEDRLLANVFYVGHQGDSSWILFDSGASQSVCSDNFATHCPVRPCRTGQPLLRSVTGQPIRPLGVRQVTLKTPNGTTLDVDFLIAKDFPFPVISAGQTLLKGYKLKSLEKDMTTNVIKGMLTNGQEEVPIEQVGTLLYIPTVGIHPRKERRILAPMPLSEPMQVEQKELLKPQGGRTDFWERKGEILVRHHKRPRNKLYTPARARDCPVPIDQLQLGRLTVAPFRRWKHTKA